MAKPDGFVNDRSMSRSRVNSAADRERGGSTSLLRIVADRSNTNERPNVRFRR